MEKIKFLFINTKIKYKNLTNYFYNQAVDYFMAGYSEAKIFLFLYAIFNFNLKLYREEKENFYLIILDKINKIYKGEPVNICIYRSKCIENLKIFLKFIEYSLIFPKYKFIKIIAMPYIIYKNYVYHKKLRVLENYILKNN